MITLPDYFPRDLANSLQFFEVDLYNGKLSPRDILEFIEKAFNTTINDFRDEELQEKEEEIESLGKDLEYERKRIEKLEEQLKVYKEGTEAIKNLVGQLDVD